ncbi:hypothetical protein [Microbacterium gorillae]|uniref:hypothetical protein n=1 Tax=Microbacterium gorillae TaxID=1231063 RepID=UPI00058F6F54|nr:hypothetical protein [Microbacterium gorillae]
MAAASTFTLANGTALACLVCRNDTFTRHAYKLQTTGMTLLNLDWANDDATCLVCASCGFIHWFDR